MALAARSSTKAGYYDAVAGKVHTGAIMKTAVNGGYMDYYVTAQPFMNHCRCSSRDSQITTWPDNTSSAVNYYINSTDYFRPARYVLEWTGTGDVILAGGSSALFVEDVSARSLPGHREYVLSQATGHSLTAVQAQIGDQVENVTFFDNAYSAEQAAGKEINQSYLADMAAYDVFRTKDWNTGDWSRFETFAAYPTTSSIYWGGGVPISVICELANDAGFSEIFVSVPHKLNDADMILYATAYFNALDSGIKVNVEYGNENWNAAPPFSDCYWWTALYNVTPSTATLTPGANPAVMTDVAHGLETGDIIKTFNSNDHYDNTSAWASGGTLRVIKIDNDTFQAAKCDNTIPSGVYSTFSTATSGSTTTLVDTSQSWTTDEFKDTHYVSIEPIAGSGVITGNTSDTLTFSGGLSTAITVSTQDYGVYSLTGEASDNATQGTLLWKKTPTQGGQATANRTGSALGHVRAWEAFDGVFGRSRVGHNANIKINDTSHVLGLYSEDTFREQLDFISFGFYWNWDDQPADIINATDATLASTQISSLETVDRPKILAHMAQLYDTYGGGTAWTCYEGGSIYTEEGNPSNLSAIKTRMYDFMQSDDYLECIDYYYKEICAPLGCLWQCWFFCHDINQDVDPDGTLQRLQGLQSYHLDQSPAYLKIKAWNDAGGIPKK